MFAGEETDLMMVVARAGEIDGMIRERAVKDDTQITDVGRKGK